MLEYHQDIVIDRLNQYLKLNHREMSLNHGYCHGFSLLWLHSMATNQEEWFYNTVHDLVSCQQPHDFEVMKSDIEKFLSHIEWLQNSSRYDYHINQLDVDQLLESSRPLSISFLFNKKSLADTLNKVMHSKEMITISGPTHTIGAYKKNNRIYLFDPNYSEGYARTFYDSVSLANEVMECLIYGNKDNLLSPLQINVVCIPEKINSLDHVCTYEDKDHLLDHLINQSNNINTPGYKDLTNLYLACESGDAHSVKRLLESGANPNVYYDKKLSPLQIAAKFGYHKIVELLLQYKADSEAIAYKKFTPLHFSAQSGHLECVKILLANQPNLKSKIAYLQSPLKLAIANQHWPVVVYLLAHNESKSKKIISNSDLTFLFRHKDDLLFTANAMNHQLTDEQQHVFNAFLKRISSQKTRYQLFTDKTKSNKLDQNPNKEKTLNQ